MEDRARNVPEEKKNQYSSKYLCPQVTETGNGKWQERGFQNRSR